MSTYCPAAGSTWSSGSQTRDPGDIICHGDFGPWNGVWRGEELVGLLDFDHARPAPPLWDVTYVLQYAAPFRPDGECRRWLHYARAPDRRRRIEIFCDSYGMPVPVDIVDRGADQEREVLQHCDVLSRRGVEPHATWVRNGYLDVVRGRISWTESLQL